MVAVGDDGLSETSVSDEGDERFETRSVQLVESIVEKQDGAFAGLFRDDGVLRQFQCYQE